MTQNAEHRKYSAYCLRCKQRIRNRSIRYCQPCRAAAFTRPWWDAARSKVTK